MSYSNSFPQQRPTLNLDFANSGKLDSRISFSRDDTPPTYAAPSAVHYWSNQQHLSSENLFPYSNAYDSSGWIKNRVDQTIGQTDPSGGTAAKLITQASGQTTAGVVYYTGTFGSDELTFSIYLKPNGRTKPNLSENLTDSGNTVKRTYFDLTGSGAVGTKDAAHTASIAKFGDWYRCTITFTPHAADSGSVYLYISDTDNSQTVADDGNGYIVYGANLSTTGQLVTNETSGSIHREYSSTLKSVSNAGAPRFEYDPTDGQSVGTALGLLVESQSTNYNTKSEDIAGWSTPSNMTVSASAMVAPNGTLTADVLTVSDDTVASGHFAYRASSDGTSGQTVAASFFAKTAGVNHIYFYDANTANAGADSVSIFDLNNGTIGGTNAPNCKMIDCGNGWWRCVSVYTLTGAGTSLRFYTTDNGSTTTYIGNGFDGFGLWGVQVEIGVSSESSYISTSGSTVSRASDSCSVALSETNYSGGEGSLVVDLSINGRTSGIGAVISDGSTENYYQVGQFATSLTYILYSELNNSVQANITQSETSVGSKKLAASWDTNDISACLDGGTVTTDTSNAFPLLTDLDIGSNPTGAAVLNGHIKRLSLYSVALSDTELQALTS